MKTRCHNSPDNFGSRRAMNQDKENVAAEMTNSIFLCISSAYICSPSLFLVVSCHRTHNIKQGDRILEPCTSTVVSAHEHVTGGGDSDLQRCPRRFATTQLGDVMKIRTALTSSAAILSLAALPAAYASVSIPAPVHALYRSNGQRTIKSISATTPAPRWS